MTRILLPIFFILFFTNASAGKGGIKGIVVDDQNEPSVGDTIYLFKDLKVLQAFPLDIDGGYEFEELSAGNYELRMATNNFRPIVITDVIVENNKAAVVKIKQQLANGDPSAVIIKYRKLSVLCAFPDPSAK